MDKLVCAVEDTPYELAIIKELVNSLTGEVQGLTIRVREVEKDVRDIAFTMAQGNNAVKEKRMFEQFADQVNKDIEKINYAKIKKESC